MKDGAHFNSHIPLGLRERKKKPWRTQSSRKRRRKKSFRASLHSNLRENRPTQRKTSGWRLKSVPSEAGFTTRGWSRTLRSLPPSHLLPHPRLLPFETSFLHVLPVYFRSTFPPISYFSNSCFNPHALSNPLLALYSPSWTTIIQAISRFFTFSSFSPFSSSYLLNLPPTRPLFPPSLLHPFFH